MNEGWHETIDHEGRDHEGRDHEGRDHKAIDHEVIDHDEQLVHDWRARQLTRSGIPAALAEAVADHVDWHQIAALIRRGCPPRLALRIVM